MVIRQITDQQTPYTESDLESELVLAGRERPGDARKTVARFALLWEQRRTLFRWTVTGLMASVILVFLIPVRYTSTTQLMPPDQAGQGMAAMLAALGKSSDLGGLGAEFLGLKTSGDMFVGVLESRTVADDLINKFDLRKVYGFRRYEDARKELKSRTEVSADRKSGIITLKISDHDPERASAMAKEYVNALNQIVTTLNTSSAHKERVFLEGRLAEVQQDLEQSEKDFSQFASKNTALDVKEQGRAMIGAAAELQGQLIAAQSELEALNQIYTPNNVRIRAVQARIEEYRRQLQKMGGKLPGNSAAQSPSPQDGNSEQQADLYPSIRELPILGVTWADLYRRTKVQEAVFETLTKQYELAKVEEARETPSVKVLDLASVPEKKSFPPRSIFVVLGTMFAFVISSVWVLARAKWDKIDSEDPGKILLTQIYQASRDTARKLVSRLSRKQQDEKESSGQES